jgi:RimJ/RimL family protein N-acetyltransferase
MEGQLLALRVQPAQQPFVGRMDALLADAQSRPTCDQMAIVLDGQVIGFYCIETRARTVAPIEFGAITLGLRGFFIDARWQGRGLGRQALRALLADLAARHPAAQVLALTVSDDNAAALALYRGAGFSDSGERYHGGPAGLQHLLLRPLGA